MDRETERLRAERRAAYLSAPRRRLVLSTSLTITGRAREAVGVESFFL